MNAREMQNWQTASIPELQAEIGRLQGILHFKVLGDQSVGVTMQMQNIGNDPSHHKDWRSDEETTKP